MTTLKRITSFFLVLSFSIFVGCGGEEEPPPITDFTQDQQKALAKFRQAAAGLNASLQSGKSPQDSQADAFMNAMLMYMTADNGKTADMDKLVSYIKGHIKSYIPQYLYLPEEQQQQIFRKLGAFYQKHAVNSPNPTIQSIASVADSRTGINAVFTNAAAGITAGSSASTALSPLLSTLGSTASSAASSLSSDILPALEIPAQ